MALSFDIGANERAAVRSVKNLSDALENTSDKLDDLARGGDKDLNKLEGSFKTLASEAKDAGKDVGKSMDDGFKKAGKGADDFKQEANSTARETAASFDGSAESIGDAFQEVAANAFGAFGPAAGLAGLAVAAGIGGIKTTFDELREKSDEIKQGILDDFIEIGDALDQEAVDSRVRDLLGNENTRKQAELLAEILKVDLADALLILAGDAQTAGTTMADAIKGVEGAAGNVDFQTFIELKNTMEATNDALEVGPALAKAREDATARAAESERSQIKRTQDADQTRFELYAAALQDARNNAAGGISVPVTLDDRTDVNALRASILRRVGRISVPIGVDLWQ